MIITQNHIVEFLALVVSIVYWKSIKKGKLKSLPFFLLFILLVELTGTYLHSIRYPNTKLYNITIPLEYLFYFYLYWKHAAKVLKIFTTFSALLLILFTLFFFFSQPLIILHSYVLVVGEVCIIFCACIYLIEQFKNGEEESLLKNYFFWFSSGLLLFSLGEFVYFLLYPAINLNKWDRFDFWFKTVNNSLLLMLYLSYIVSIVIYKKYNKLNATGY